FGSFVSQATEATHSTNYPQHSSATNFTALRRALDYDTLFSKSATSFLPEAAVTTSSPSPSKLSKSCVSVSEPASIREFSLGTQDTSYKNFQAAESTPASGETRHTGANKQGARKRD
ncbi:hypothetical protein, partial [uncultured Pseudacidovorax sp.]|uniref:hypothetical protein n=1 Tax=uncultured Pseudacidovorax sp. TaxID=679313 RepID=UPI0025D736D8